METLITLILLASPLLVVVATCYAVKLVIDNLFKAGTAAVMYSQRQKTQQHYYDHTDKYLDFEKNQWFYK
jgi:hypothetical protein